MLFFILKLLACNSGFVGSFATHCSGMRSWPLKWYIVFLTCFKTKGWSASRLPISCLMYCRSVCHGVKASAQSVLWLACSVFIFYPCESSEASGINLTDKSICENRNRLSNPQNLVFVQFKWKISKILEGGHFRFGSASWVQRSPWGMMCGLWLSRIPAIEQNQLFTECILFTFQ